MREGDSEAESEKEEQQTHQRRKFTEALAFVHLLSFVARFDFFPEAIQINQKESESQFTAIFYL